MDNGSNLNLNGEVTVTAANMVFEGAYLVLDSASQLQVTNNSTIVVGTHLDLYPSLDGDGYADFGSGCYLLLRSGSNILGYSGSTITGNSGSTVSLSGTTNLLGTVNTNSWPKWTSSQSRYINQPIQVGQALTGTWTQLVQGVSSNAAGNQWVCCLDRLHNGATLNQVVVMFQVWLTHTGVPANMPTVSVLRYNNSTMASAVALGIPDPQSYTPVPSTGSAWYNSQATKYLVYECVHNNVIDNSQYSYFVVVTDESGTNALAENNYGMISLSFNAIPDQSWQL